MAVGFKVDFEWYQIGNGDFLYSFFSTVAYHLEGGKWGSRFPIIMKKLYQGKLKWKEGFYICFFRCVGNSEGGRLRYRDRVCVEIINDTLLADNST